MKKRREIFAKKSKPSQNFRSLFSRIHTAPCLCNATQATRPNHVLVLWNLSAVIHQRTDEFERTILRSRSTGSKRFTERRDNNRPETAATVSRIPQMSLS